MRITLPSIEGHCSRGNVPFFSRAKENKTEKTIRNIEVK
jgi:hypothetical protein